MSQPPRPLPPWPGPNPKPMPGATVTVLDPGCGHIGDEPHDWSCEYWRDLAAKRIGSAR